MRNYTIKITGSGTFKEIARALLGVVDDMEIIITENQEPSISDINWEDSVLMTEITEEE